MWHVSFYFHRHEEKMKVALKEQEAQLAVERAAALKQQQADMQNLVNAAIAEKDELLTLYSKVHTRVCVCVCVLMCCMYVIMIWSLLRCSSISLHCTSHTNTTLSPLSLLMPSFSSLSSSSFLIPFYISHSFSPFSLPSGKQTPQESAQQTSRNSRQHSGDM